MELVVDSELSGEIVQAHPGVNTRTLALALDDVLLMARHTGHRARLVDIPGTEE